MIMYFYVTLIRGGSRAAATMYFYVTLIRGGSRAAATPKMKHFVIIVNS